MAVLDCGIYASHPDLVGQVVLSKNVTAAATTDDRCGHGTAVAGIIAALTNNGIGVTSIAPGARLLNGKVLDDGGHGLLTDVENGIRWAADNGARVVNLSLGIENMVCPASTQAAVNYARAKGVVIVAASGNTAQGPLATPANCTGVVSVGAVDRKDAKAPFSSGMRVALAAPGADGTVSFTRTLDLARQAGLVPEAALGPAATDLTTPPDGVDASTVQKPRCPRGSAADRGDSAAHR